MLRALVIRIFLSSQPWLVAALVAVGGSFAVDYVDAQRTADRALALRQGPPPATLVQDFVPARHVGPAREVLVRAETRLGDPTIVKLGRDGQPRSAVIFPLFAVSQPGQAALATAMENPAGLAAIRPVPRPKAEAPTPRAIGVILHISDRAESDLPDSTTLIARRFGGGAHGRVVEVNGTRVSPGDMALVVKGAMAARNIDLSDDFLAIAPFENGREAALAPPPSSGLQRGLFWGGMTLALGAALLSVRVTDHGPDLPRRPGRQDTRAAPAESAKARDRFRSIPTQDEVYAADMARRANETGRKKRPGLTGVLLGRR